MKAVYGFFMEQAIRWNGEGIYIWDNFDKEFKKARTLGEVAGKMKQGKDVYFLEYADIRFDDDN